MTSSVKTAVSTAPADRRGRGLARILLRPEFTAVAGTAIVFAYFALSVGAEGFLSETGVRNFLAVAAELGIIAALVTLLLIAGEFDLSVGAMVGTGTILFAYPITEWGWPMLPSLLLAFGGACVIGLVNGFIIVKSGVPSFIVTLAMLFVLTGATLAITTQLTGATQIFSIRETVGRDPLLGLFDGSLLGLPVAVYWWFAVTLLAAVVLDRTKIGNWIYATGGDREAARKTGVPVNKVKIGLFMATASAATLVAVLIVFVGDSADVSAGANLELQAAAAAVIGGAMITGGYGSPIGTAFGALLFGMVSQGFFYTSIDNNWFQAFLGAMLLAAVLLNTFSRHRSTLQMKGRS